MLNAIINFSLRNKLIVLLAVFALCVAGFINLRNLSVDALPDITSNQVQVITSSPSLAAPEVERLITFTVEQQCANIQGIIQMRSISRFGLSVVTLVFDDGIDIYWARQQVAERLGDIKENIPSGAGTPFMAPLTTGLGEVYQYIVKPAAGYESKYSLADLRSIQDWIIRRQLLGTPGVADVSSFGGNLKQYEIAFSPEKLQALNVSLDELYAALQQNNENSGGSYIEKNNQAFFIRTEGLLEDVEGINQVLVKTNASGTPVFVKDIATVQLGRARRYGALVDGSQGEVSGAVVLMLKGANGLEVISNLKAKMEQITKMLPEGIEVEVFYDRSKLVNRAIATVQKNLAEGALIVVFVLVLFLGNLRAGMIVASVIPLAMLFAIIMMNLFKVSGNLMSLGALDFGLIVDGAVIIVEAVLHQLHMRQHRGGEVTLSQAEMDGEVQKSASKMMNSAMFGQIIILIVYFPILALVGVEGKMFRPMAQTVSFALIGAALLSLTYVPVMTSLGLNKKLKFKTNLADRFMHQIEKRYIPSLRFAMRRKALVLVSTLLIFVVSLFVMTRLGGEFIPEMEEGDFAVDTRLLTGASLESSIDYAKKAAFVLEEHFPEVDKIVSRVGASEIPTDPMPIEMGDLIILLKDKKEWTSAKSFDELADTMSRVLEQIPGLSAGFQFPVQMRFNELISGARQDVVCKIYGENLDTLATYAEKIGRVVERVDGANDIYVEAVTGLPQVVIRMNRQAMALYGVSVRQINDAVQTGFAGKVAGTVYENERRYDMVLRLDKSDRDAVEDVEKILISTASGANVPLHQLASVRVEEGPNQIQRENAQRRIMVAFNVRGRDVESLVTELQQHIEKEIKLPPGYFIHYGGAFENLKTASNRLAIAVPAALALILLLLYFAFGKIKYALLIFTAIPLSAIGGILALWIRGMPFSISAGVGFIALFGVAVLNGIVLIAEFNRRRDEEGLTPAQAVIRGTSIRLRPVLMTASVASFGFLPMALSTSPGAEVQRPLATVVIGGLTSATFLTLMVLPLLYLIMETGKLKIKNWRKPAATVLALMLMQVGLHAQEPGRIYSRQQVMELLPTQNLEWAGNPLEQSALRAMIESAGQRPALNLSSEFGQLDGPYVDLKLSATQQFLPRGYAAAQRKGFETDLNLATARFQLRQAEIRYLASVQMNDMLYFRELMKTLDSADSLYAKLIVLAEQRLKYGETSGLELAGFEMAKAKWNQQKIQAQLDNALATTQLGTLLQVQESISLSDSFRLLLPDSRLPDGGSLHPSLAMRQLEIQQFTNEAAIQSAALKPSFEIGVINQSFTGWNTNRANNNKWLDLSNRFFAGMVGVQIPIFRKPYLQRLEALKWQQRFAENQLKVAAQQWEMNRSLNAQRLQNSLLKLRQLEDKWLTAANRVLDLAGQQLNAGELNFLNWMALVEPALAVKLNHLELIREINNHYYYRVYLNEKSN